ncbi:MAG: hypothetical protein JOY93_09405 [Acidobacteriales bacterium]|nr:hypothetical protein [Terriglobales bacterium]
MMSAKFHPRPRTVVASGLLCVALSLVVLFTSRGSFSSPMAVVVVSAIGLAAVLLQLRFRNRENLKPVRPPVFLNMLGIIFALAAVFADIFRLSPQLAQLMALGAVGSFGISSAIILHAFRKRPAASK